MEEIVLTTTLDDSSRLYISPIDRETYAEHVIDDNLGGDDGYFVLVSRKGKHPALEVLAKAPTLDAAKALFDLIVRASDEGRRRAGYSLAPLFR